MAIMLGTSASTAGRTRRSGVDMQPPEPARKAERWRRSSTMRRTPDSVDSEPTSIKQREAMAPIEMLDGQEREETPPRVRVGRLFLHLCWLSQDPHAASHR